jgi:hypothetical protein
LNTIYYGSQTIPLIPIEDIDDSIPIHIYVGKDDDISTVKDAQWLRDSVKGVMKYQELDGFGHTDFLSVKFEKAWFVDEVINEFKSNVPVEDSSQMKYVTILDASNFEWEDLYYDFGSIYDS